MACKCLQTAQNHKAKQTSKMCFETAVFLRFFPFKAPHDHLMVLMGNRGWGNI